MSIIKTAAKKTAALFDSVSDMPNRTPRYAVPAAISLVLALGAGAFTAYLATETGHAILNELKRRRRLREKRPESPSLRGTPTPEELEADGKIDPRTLAVRLRLGSRLADLEPTLATRFEHRALKNGQKRIKARAPGLKGWLSDRRVSLNYSTLVRYKKLAQRLRQLLQLDDRLPLEWLLPGEEAEMELPPELRAQYAGARRRMARLMREHPNFSRLARHVEDRLGIPQLLSARRAKRRAADDASERRRRKRFERSRAEAHAKYGGPPVVRPDRVEATKRELIRFLREKDLPGSLDHLRNKAVHWLQTVGVEEE